MSRTTRGLKDGLCINRVSRLIFAVADEDREALYKTPITGSGYVELVGYTDTRTDG